MIWLLLSRYALLIVWCMVFVWCVPTHYSQVRCVKKVSATAGGAGKTALRQIEFARLIEVPSHIRRRHLHCKAQESKTNDLRSLEISWEIRWETNWNDFNYAKVLARFVGFESYCSQVLIKKITPRGTDCVSYWLSCSSMTSWIPSPAFRKQVWDQQSEGETYILHVSIWGGRSWIELRLWVNSWGKCKVKCHFISIHCWDQRLSISWVWDPCL